MKIKEAKENVMKNFRANYTPDHMDLHDIEVFLLNTMEQLTDIAFEEGLVVGRGEAERYKEDAWKYEQLKK